MMKKTCLYMKIAKWYLKRLTRKERFLRVSFIGKGLKAKQEKCIHGRDNE